MKLFDGEDAINYLVIALMVSVIILWSLRAHGAERTINWKLLTVTAVEVGADTFDQHVTLEGTRLYQKTNGAKGCQEANVAPPFPSAKRLYIQNYSIDGGLFLVGYLLRKKHVPIVPYAPLLTAAVKHVDGGARWYLWNCL